ncbi:hypothetical protein [Streptosporangium sp. NPDC000509]|uniref:hypothetical protein n=1 Tax=Streptosporangium sp. NPDC000509 TaxID=3366186 RepID=UPI0036B4EBBA
MSAFRNTIQQFRAHRLRRNVERLAAGEAWLGSGFVFVTETGEALFPGDATAEFKQLAMEARPPRTPP